MKISETEIELDKLKLKISKDKTQKLNLEGRACEKKQLLVIFPSNRISVCRTCVKQITTASNSRSKGSDVLFWSPWKHAHVYINIHIYT